MSNNNNSIKNNTEKIIEISYNNNDKRNKDFIVIIKN